MVWYAVVLSYPSYVMYVAIISMLYDVLLYPLEYVYAITTVANTLPSYYVLVVCMQWCYHTLAKVEAFRDGDTVYMI